jgi:hypothetical protein
MSAVATTGLLANDISATCEVPQMDGEGGIDHQKFNRQPADHATLRRQAAARERTATPLPSASCLEHQLQPHLLRSCREVQRTPDLAANMRANSPVEVDTDGLDHGCIAMG